MARMEIISGIELRWRWPLEVKVTMLAQAAQPGARVCEVARRFAKWIFASIMLPPSSVSAR